MIEKKNKEGLNEQYIYNNNGVLELDENLMNLDIVNFKITNCLYQHKVLQDEYKRYGFNTTDEKRVIYTDKLAENPKAKISFKDLFNEYVSLRSQVFYYYPIGNEAERMILIEREKPLIKEAFEKLGAEKVKEMSYHVGNIKRALISLQTDISTDTKIMKCLKDYGVTEGTTLPIQDFKLMLQDIYTCLGLKNSYGKIKTAKATDLEKWFEIKKTTPKMKGKTTDCITIIKNKLIYV